MSILRLDGKVAAVTGAGSGIGKSIAILFARQGARIAALDVNGEALAEVTGEILKVGGDTEGIHCDVSDPGQVRQTFDTLTKRFGRQDILVNNAGIAHVGNAQNTSLDDFERVYRVNVRGVFLCTQAALSGMLKQGGGVIVNMASIASLTGVADRYAYSMSKGAVLAMTRSVALDYVKQNIRCNCICPARVHTPFVDGFLAKNYPGREAEMFKRLSEYQPLGRMGKPEEMAFMALCLASDESSFVTGQAFPLDGGVLIA